VYEVASKRFGLPVGVCLIGAVLLRAQAPGPLNARDLLIHSDETPLAAAGFTLKGVEVTRLIAAGYGQSIETTFSVDSAPGGRLRLERKTGNAIILQIADGSTLWTYRPEIKDYFRLPMQHELRVEWVDQLRSGRDPANFKEPRILREERMEFGGEPVECAVVRAAYAFLPGNPAAREVVRTVWIARRDGLVLRDTWEFALPGSGSVGVEKSHIATDYTSIEWGTPLPGDRFTFHPPSDSSPAGGRQTERK